MGHDDEALLNPPPDEDEPQQRSIPPRPGQEGSYRARQRRRIAMLLVLPAILIFAGAVLYVVLAADDDDDKVDTLPGADRYTIAYRLVESGQTLTRCVSVERPFLGVASDWQGAEGTCAGRLVRQAITQLGQRADVTPDSKLLLGLPAEPAAGDVRLDSYLPEALERGDAERLEDTTIAGRACTRYRIGGPADAVPIPALVPGVASFSDVCVDAQGLLLAEEDTRDGAVVRELTALAVDTEPEFTDRTFQLPGTAADVLSLIDGGGAFERQDNPDQATGAPRLFRMNKTALLERGYGFNARYAAVQPTLGRVTTPVDPTTLPLLLEDVFRACTEPCDEDDNNDLSLWLVQGFDPVAAAALPPPGARPVGNTPLGPAYVVDGGRYSELHIVVGDDMVLRLEGTVPPSQLVEIAQLIEEVDLTSE